MKCPKCGKENPDIRLFCMSCGELMPEEALDDVQKAAHVQEEIEVEVSESKPGTPEAPEEIDAEDIPDDDTEFFRTRQRTRKVIEDIWPEDNKPKSVEKTSIFDIVDEKPMFHADSPYARREETAEIKQKPLLGRNQSTDIGTPSTFIPKREERMDPDDFFSVKGQVLPEYDEKDESHGKPSRKNSGRRYEDEPKQSFVSRHMRGIVTLMLLALTGIIVLIWSNTGSAQLMLASIDMAWKPEAYARLAEDAYATKDLSAAGYYFTKAYERDSDNYNYAVMAANSYIEGGYTSKALNAVRECIAIKPEDVNLYLMLLDLQPDAADISESDMELIGQGYRLTGDDRLNIE